MHEENILMMKTTVMVMQEMMKRKERGRSLRRKGKRGNQ